MVFLQSWHLLFLECIFADVTNTAKDTIQATTISNCADGKISQTEYWNMRYNNSGYWHNKNDVVNYSTMEPNGSVLVSSWFLFLSFYNVNYDTLASRKRKTKLRKSLDIVSLKHSNI